VAAGRLLRIDQRAVDFDLEDAAAGGDQLGLQAELPLDLVRQTGGDGLVVSDPAVFDAQLLQGAS
jgi:hypothetical protein